MRAVSLALVLAFFIQEIAYATPNIIKADLGSRIADRAEVHKAWARSVLPDIPASVATIEDAWHAPDGAGSPIADLGSRINPPSVILIQDAHTNDSGQLNIARLLDILFQDRGSRIADRDSSAIRDPKSAIQYIFLEAGLGNESLSFLRKYAPLAKRKQIAESFLRQGKLQGTEYFDLTSNREFVLWGVEDLSLYAKSVTAYRAVAQKRERLEDYLARVELTIEALKPEIYNPLLLSFDKTAAAATALPEYFDALIDEAKLLGLSLKNYPHVRRFARLRNLESKIDFKKANEEEQKAIESLSEEDQKELAGAGFKPAPTSRDPKIQGAFFALLEEKIRRGGFQTRPYPELFKYFDYLKQASAIEPQALLAERKALEEALFRALATNEDEAELAKASKNIQSLKKIFNLTIAPDEYEVYKNEKSAFDIKRITGFLNKKIMDLRRAYDKAVFLEDGYEDVIARCEEFYELTYERDKAFVGNMLKKLDERTAGDAEEGSHGRGGPRAEHPWETEAAGPAIWQTAILITGGYHTPNLKYLLKEKGISFISLTPQITNETNQKRYEKILLGQDVSKIRPPSFSPAAMHLNALLLKPRARFGMDTDGARLTQDLSPAARIAWDEEMKLSRLNLGSTLPLIEQKGTRGSDPRLTLDQSPAARLALRLGRFAPSLGASGDVGSPFQLQTSNFELGRAAAGARLAEETRRLPGWPIIVEKDREFSAKDWRRLVGAVRLIEKSGWRKLHPDALSAIKSIHPKRGKETGGVAFDHGSDIVVNPTLSVEEIAYILIHENQHVVNHFSTRYRKIKAYEKGKTLLFPDPFPSWLFDPMKEVPPSYLLDELLCYYVMHQFIQHILSQPRLIPDENRKSLERLKLRSWASEAIAMLWHERANLNPQGLAWLKEMISLWGYQPNEKEAESVGEFLIRIRKVYAAYQDLMKGHSEAALKLVKIGPFAAFFLTDLFWKDVDDAFRMQIIHILEQMGPAAIHSIPEVTETLKRIESDPNENEPVRKAVGAFLQTVAISERVLIQPPAARFADPANRRANLSAGREPAPPDEVSAGRLALRSFDDAQDQTLSEVEWVRRGQSSADLAQGKRSIEGAVPSPSTSSEQAAPRNPFKEVFQPDSNVSLENWFSHLRLPEPYSFVAKLAYFQIYREGKQSRMPVFTVSWQFDRNPASLGLEMGLGYSVRPDHQRLGILSSFAQIFSHFLPDNKVIYQGIVNISTLVRLAEWLAPVRGKMVAAFLEFWKTHKASFVESPEFESLRAEFSRDPVIQVWQKFQRGLLEAILLDVHFAKDHLSEFWTSDRLAETIPGRVAAHLLPNRRTHQMRLDQGHLKMITTPSAARLAASADEPASGGLADREAICQEIRDKALGQNISLADMDTGFQLFIDSLFPSHPSLLFKSPPPQAKKAKDLIESALRDHEVDIDYNQLLDYRRIFKDKFPSSGAEPVEGPALEVRPEGWSNFMKHLETGVRGIDQDIEQIRTLIEEQKAESARAAYLELMEKIDRLARDTRNDNEWPSFLHLVRRPRRGNEDILKIEEWIKHIASQEKELRRLLREKILPMLNDPEDAVRESLSSLASERPTVETPTVEDEMRAERARLETIEAHVRQSSVYGVKPYDQIRVERYGHGGFFVVYEVTVMVANPENGKEEVRFLPDVFKLPRDPSQAIRRAEWGGPADLQGLFDYIGTPGVPPTRIERVEVGGYSCEMIVQEKREVLMEALDEAVHREDYVEAAKIFGLFIERLQDLLRKGVFVIDAGPENALIHGPYASWHDLDMAVRVREDGTHFLNERESVFGKDIGFNVLNFLSMLWPILKYRHKAKLAGGKQGELMDHAKAIRAANAAAALGHRLNFLASDKGGAMPLAGFLYRLLQRAKAKPEFFDSLYDYFKLKAYERRDSINIQKAWDVLTPVMPQNEIKRRIQKALGGSSAARLSFGAPAFDGLDSAAARKLGVEVQTTEKAKTVLRKAIADFSKPTPLAPPYGGARLVGNRQSDLEIAQVVLGHYGIGTVADITPLKAFGRHGQSLLIVTDQGKFVLRPLAGNLFADPEAAALYEVSVINRLGSVGLPVAPLVKTKDSALTPEESSYFVKAENNKVYLLYRYVEGEIIDRLAVTDERRHQMVNTLADFHNALKGFSPKGKKPAVSIIDFSEDKDRFEKLWRRVQEKRSPGGTEPLTEIEQFVSDNHDFIQRQFDLLEKNLPAESYGSLLRLPIHGDYWAPNIIFAGDEVKAVIDWSESREEVRIYDFFNWLIQNRTPDNRFNLKELTKIIRWYHQKSPLTSQEVAVLPEIVRARYLRLVMNIVHDEKYLNRDEPLMFEQVQRNLIVLRDIDQKIQDGSFAQVVRRAVSAARLAISETEFQAILQKFSEQKMFDWIKTSREVRVLFVLYLAKTLNKKPSDLVTTNFNRSVIGHKRLAGLLEYYYKRSPERSRITALRVIQRDVRIQKAEWGQLSFGKAALKHQAILDLKHEDSSVKEDAIIDLGLLGSEAEEAVDGLRILLRDNDPQIRSWAVWALDRIGPPAVPALIDALKDKDRWVLISTLQSLVSMGSTALPAVPSLRKLLKHRDYIVQTWAESAIRAAFPDHKWGWEISALRTSLRMTQNQFIESVMASALPSKKFNQSQLSRIESGEGNRLMTEEELQAVLAEARRVIDARAVTQARRRFDGARLADDRPMQGPLEKRPKGLFAGLRHVEIKRVVLWNDFEALINEWERQYGRNGEIDTVEYPDPSGPLRGNRALYIKHWPIDHSVGNLGRELKNILIGRIGSIRPPFVVRLMGLVDYTDKNAVHYAVKVAPRYHRRYKEAVKDVKLLLDTMAEASLEEQKDEALKNLVQWQREGGLPQVAGRIVRPAEIIIGHLDQSIFYPARKDEIIRFFLALLNEGMNKVVHLLVVAATDVATAKMNDQTKEKDTKIAFQLLAEFAERVRSSGDSRLFGVFESGLREIAEMGRRPRLLERTARAVIKKISGGPVGGSRLASSERIFLPEKPAFLEDERFVTALLDDEKSLLTADEKWVLIHRFKLDDREPKKLEDLGRDLRMTKEAARRLQGRALWKGKHFYNTLLWRGIDKVSDLDQLVSVLWVFNKRTRAAFHRLNIVTIRDLLATPPAEFLKGPNFDRGSLEEIKRALAHYGLAPSGELMGLKLVWDESKDPSLLNTSVKELGLGKRSLTALETLVVRERDLGVPMDELTLRHVLERGLKYEDFARLRNFGALSQKELFDVLKGKGLVFGARMAESDGNVEELLKEARESRAVGRWDKSDEALMKAQKNALKNPEQNFEILLELSKNALRRVRERAIKREFAQAEPLLQHGERLLNETATALANIERPTRLSQLNALVYWFERLSLEIKKGFGEEKPFFQSASQAFFQNAIQEASESTSIAIAIDKKLERNVSNLRREIAGKPIRRENAVALILRRLFAGDKNKMALARAVVDQFMWTDKPLSKREMLQKERAGLERRILSILANLSRREVKALQGGGFSSADIVVLEEKDFEAMMKGQLAVKWIEPTLRHIFGLRKHAEVRPLVDRCKEISRELKGQSARLAEPPSLSFDRATLTDFTLALWKEKRNPAPGGRLAILFHLRQSPFVARIEEGQNEKGERFVALKLADEERALITITNPAARLAERWAQLGQAEFDASAARGVLTAVRLAAAAADANLVVPKKLSVPMAFEIPIAARLAAIQDARQFEAQIELLVGQIVDWNRHSNVSFFINPSRGARLSPVQEAILRDISGRFPGRIHVEAVPQNFEGIVVRAVDPSIENTGPRSGVVYLPFSGIQKDAVPNWLGYFSLGYGISGVFSRHLQKDGSIDFSSVTSQELERILAEYNRHLQSEYQFKNHDTFIAVVSGQAPNEVMTHYAYFLPIEKLNVNLVIHGARVAYQAVLGSA